MSARTDDDASSGASGTQPDHRTAAPTHIRWWIIPFSTLLCAAQAVGTLLATHISGAIMTPALISVVAFGALFVAVLVLNPVMRLVFRERLLRPLQRAELMCVFTAMLVTSGISTFGLADQVVPMIATPWNEEWNTAQRGWSDHVLPNLNSALYLSADPDASPEAQAEALANIRKFREGLTPVDAEGQPMPRPADGAPLLGEGGYLAYYFVVARQIPWSAWLGPLGAWLVFVGACYAMFYSLTYVVIHSWIQREKLIFPLAQLPEQLLPEEGGRRWLPATLRSSGFWMAFALVFAVWSWNGAVAAEWIPGLGRINLGMGRNSVAGVLSGTHFEGLVGGQMGLQFLIIFTAIGIAFLLPTAISFSLWFYFLVGKFMILGLVWFGYGQTSADFPTNISELNNTVTAQGGGALLMFAAITLGRAVMDLIDLGRGKSLAQKVTLGLPVLALAVSLAVIFGWLRWNDLPLAWALIVTAVLLLITMALMRVVAEGGMYWFQLHTGPVHLYHTFGLGHIFKPASAIVPLLSFYWVMFWDLKTFLAPNLANSVRMHESVGGGRFKFHLNIVLAMVVSVVVALGFAIILAHVLGGQQMNSWFYTSGPTHIFDVARDAVASEPRSDLGNALSYVFGAGWLAFSVFIRSVLFWFPHPIGYVMMANPLMGPLWFSIFLGWLAKRFVVRYGGKATFEMVRPIFIGLIMGELMVVLWWAGLGIIYDFEPGVTFNRYRS